MTAVGDQKITLILSEDELFAALASSAFEFLAKAIEEFSASAKFSTVHFAIAIELFLKARLMREHWALLLDKPDQADKAAFFRGEAKTVSPEQALDRLRKIGGVQIPPVSREIFLKIAKHRNKMVHFVHAGEKDVDSEEGLALLVAEQCAGWLALRLLLEEWREFEAYKENIRFIGFQMECHRAYLVESFKAKQEELGAHRKGGGRVAVCPSCKFESVCVFEATGAISPASCVVCRYNGSEIEITCTNEDCRSPIQFNAYEMAPEQCPACGTVIDEDFLQEALNTGEAVTCDNYFDHVDLNCPFCSGYHTVVEHHGGYVCVQCFEMSDEMGICGHCSEGQLGGVSEHSSLVGCEFCEGSAGRYADD
ncbi:hypothetical protein SAMN05216404_12415 [Nitrosospira multiformis]|uniref:HsdR n=1 Tax=Nitrosospira multiformis TaxID=1231 RepID=A0A1H8PXY2_9PROT|nr:hypothetical protein [Nitrosospira multiformis]SEO46872.1 hypothetical protein SAMN05216404_12415 [Nitrosospira multiformis]